MLISLTTSVQAAEGPVVSATSCPAMAQELKVEQSELEFIRELVDRKATQYDVSANELWLTIGCETGQTYDPNLRATSILKYGQEKSYGLAMIHLPDHPDVTIKMATDPEFAVDFMAKNWKKHKYWWVCARKLEL